ncbi:MAG: c-type cytochrome [Bacteroidota bacterium]
MMIRSLITSLLLTFFLGFSSSTLWAQEATPDGKALFKANCASCHNKDMKNKLTGPALGGTEERWADYPKEDLYEWIRNSQKMISDGHPKAKELWAEWAPTVMTAFPNLTDADIDAILCYINGVYTGEGPCAPPPSITSNDVAGGGAADSGTSPAMMLLLFGVLAVFAVVLARIVSNLNHMTAVQAGVEAPPRQSLVELLTSKPVIGFVIFAAVILGGYTTVNNAIDMGRQQNYAPEQPIKFSHETHAGIHQIDCNYCHDGARRSKHATIPAVNTCMNCHTAVKVGSEYGTEELTKIYASAGWDPNTGQYIENYEDMPADTAKAIFAKWIDETYRAENDGKKESAITREVNRQVEGVLPFINQPIVWERIHNLPDHAYFNHAQHVTAGEVECQDCHGKVEEMEVVVQYSPLSMGWCINCHRETAVQFEGNDYYTKSYQQYHKDLQSGNVDKITVEDIGGLECQKCHY